MGDDKNKGPLLPISGVLLLAAALGVTIFTQPFKGKRPPAAKLPEPYEKISARLWQDPFSAVLDGKRSSGAVQNTNKFEIEKDGQDSKASLWPEIAKKKEHVTVVGVMVQGQSYAENAESRMRYRYAVLSGLSRVHFIPDDPEHINFIKVKNVTKEDKSVTKIGLSNIIPFEWLTAAQGKNGEQPASGHVLLLWINEDTLGREPLKKISRLVSFLGVTIEKQQKQHEKGNSPGGEARASPAPTGKAHDGKPKTVRQVRFVLIGPPDSDHLQKMIDEANKRCKYSQLHNMEIYSPVATIDSSLLFPDEKGEQCLEMASKEPHNVTFARTIGSDKDLAKKLVQGLNLMEIYSPFATIDRSLLFPETWGENKDQDKEAEEKLKNIFKTKHNITFTRTIGSDKALAKALVKELELRGVDLKDQKKNMHLVLVAEWDTDYGRSFAGYFKEIIDPTHSRAFEKRFHPVSYMRGIDGGLPEEQEKEKKKSEKTEGQSDPPAGLAKLEQPVGRSQYDYIRRLADEVHRLNRDLKQKDAGEIKAIGVLGTDFYDKYLVLQALRQKFPDVIYFSTDMDARLLHPDNIKWTRNLVVASHFDLLLRKDAKYDVQGEIPPFRESYQTSLFFTILRTFGRHLESSITPLIKPLPGDEAPKTSLIFEIGRTRAINLTRDPLEGTVHPQRRDSPLWSAIERHPGKIALMLLLALGVLFLTSPALKQNWRFMVTCIVSLIAFGAVALWISSYADEEPLSLLHGISIWPSECLRAIAILLSVCFLIKAYYDLKKNSADIKSGTDFVDIFGLPEQKPGSGFPRKDSRPEKWERVKTVLQLDWPLHENGAPLTLKDLWEEYATRDAWKYHAIRVSVIVLFYFAFCALIIHLDPPFVPVRGPWSIRIDQIITYFSAGLFAILVFYVFSVTRCCGRFILFASGALSGRIEKIAKRELTFVREDVERELTFVRLVARRTEPIEKLIFYPFIVWFLMVVSRMKYFDNWETPVGLWVVITLGALIAWSCAYRLRRAAEDVRTLGVERLNALLLKVHKDVARSGARRTMIETIEFTLDQVKNIREGAFAPFSQRPLMRSLLIPFGSAGGYLLLEIFNQYGK